MYVRIIDQGECLSTTREYVDGVYANKNEWAKHNFYPKNGMVGELVKRTPISICCKDYGWNICSDDKKWH